MKILLEKKSPDYQQGFRDCLEETIFTMKEYPQMSLDGHIKALEYTFQILNTLGKK